VFIQFISSVIVTFLAAGYWQKCQPKLKIPVSFLYTEIRYTSLCIWKRTDKDFKLVTESVNGGGICCHSFCVALEAWKIFNVTDSQLHFNLTDTVHKQGMCVVFLKTKIISR
jgi:hypothetical protein